MGSRLRTAALNTSARGLRLSFEQYGGVRAPGPGDPEGAEIESRSAVRTSFHEWWSV